MKLLILSTRTDFNFTRINDEKTFSSWTKFNREQGMETALGGVDTYSDGKFSKVFAWDVDGNKVELADYAPDVIMLRPKNKLLYPNYAIFREITSKIKTVNSMDFCLTMDKKSNQYMIFKKFQPKTVIVQNIDEVKNFLEDKDGEYILKPDLESGGEGIKIISKNNIPESIEGLHLVQEMVDNSHGIENIIDGRHDLRFTFIGGKLAVIVLRIPAEGKFLANAHQGGRTKVLEEAEITPKIMDFVNEVSASISSVWGNKNIYSIDVLIENKTEPHLIEINTMPGFSFIDEASQQKLFKAYLELFTKIAQ